MVEVVALRQLAAVSGGVPAFRRSGFRCATFRLAIALARLGLALLVGFAEFVFGQPDARELALLLIGDEGGVFR